MNNSKDPLVSIIVPSYNSEEYISKCIDSLLKQSFTNFEIIAIDDGSQDDTFNKLKNYSKKDSRIKCVREKNSGRSVARNNGLSKSSGKYVTFVDSDDYVSSEYLAHLIDGITSNTEIAMIDIIPVNDEGMILNNRKHYASNISISRCKESIRRVLHQKPDNEICGKLFKRELFENLEFPIGKIYEDLYMTFALMCKAKKISFVDSPDYFYVQRSNNTMNSDFNKKNMDILEMGEKARKTILCKYPELENDVSSKLFAAYSNVWMKINKDKYEREYGLLWSEIKKNRSKILFTKIENRNVLFGVYASLLGTDIYRNIYKIVRKR
ncbi:hypothetical protein C5L30_001300 [Companilactobacillus farciminis]|uniref:Glycosyltransferase 2-like domain-containing protein n=1 Tax=Companilactobacillus farciminis TaxID=1612 RepID=A0A4V3A3A2_9LACO|nr:glycosyltransferase family 2 protein [Companilactobacillus farciminis]ATO45700.1 hypothetical protein LF20184_02525 [Companilactobacillus farciminis KCTC 3681 = DSM 20184]KRK62326.1 exopolysaccharide biosynthesis protein, sugar transferase [Companilactobacillus farciminis KCTC 3681 = DSM 20184]TDG73808.1 hypothetical protein C5L30_001300 [Companilactobacillus farciminis]